jgi:hypothetical protein
MNNVLIEYEYNNPATATAIAFFKRVFDYMEIQTLFKLGTQIRKDDLEWCDCLLSIRPASLVSLKLAESVENAGRTYLAFYDDDLLELFHFRNSESVRLIFIRKCLALSAAVITPTPLLADEYKLYTKGKQAYIINVLVEDREIIANNTTHSVTRLIYASGRKDVDDFYAFVTPALKNIYDEFGSSIELTLMCAEPDQIIIKSGMHVTHIPLLPFEQYRKFLIDNRFDIGLAPLSNNKFSNRKYFNKYIEYAINGIAGIYSNCLPYTLIVENGVNGILVEPTVEAWTDAIRTLVKDKLLCRNIAEASQNILRERFSLDNIIEIFRDIAAISQGRRKKVFYHRFFAVRCNELCVYYMSMRKLYKYISDDGLLFTLRRIVNHMDNMKRYNERI